jgi:threonine synthase
MSTALRAPVQPARPIRNPLLRGLQCLRCNAPYPIRLAHEGCPACRAEGVHVSLRASYGYGAAGMAGASVPLMPYTQGFTLGEGDTPLLALPELARRFGIARLAIKDESCNPTGSHKDRMSALGVSQALDFGAHTLVLASSGNAAVSAARYAQLAGLTCEVATYEDMPAAYAKSLASAGARRFAFADNAARWAFVRERAQRAGFFALTNHSLPALGSAPTARGDLAWGIFAGFRDLLAAGRIARLPRIWAVEPFARLSRVLEGGALEADYPGRTAQFSTAGTTVTFLQWQAVVASGGGAVVVGDDEARAARRLLTQAGVSAELCAASGLGALQRLRERGAVGASDHVVLMLTADASRDPSWPDPV